MLNVDPYALGRCLGVIQGVRRNMEATLTECASTKWTGIAQLVQLRETTRLSVRPLAEVEALLLEMTTPIKGD